METWMDSASSTGGRSSSIGIGAAKSGRFWASPTTDLVESWPRWARVELWKFCVPFVVSTWWLSAKGCRGFRRRQPCFDLLFNCSELDRTNTPRGCR